MNHDSLKPSQLETGRENLLHLLGIYSNANNSKIIIIFDGQAKSKETKQPGNIEIIFTATSKTTDDLVIQKALSQSDPKQVTVISSDLYIKDSLKNKKITVIDSIDFLKELIRLKKETILDDETISNTKRKLDGISAEETQGWLETFGIKDKTD